MTAAVWLGAPEAARFFDADALSAAERQRYDNLRGPGRRDEFAVSRALRSAALGGRNDVSSLSHSGGWAAVAHAPAGYRVGVDIEKSRPRDVLALARFAFDPQETAALAQLAETPRERMFYALWTMKEAMAKALGIPLLTATRQCVFTLREDHWHGTAPTQESWWLRTYQVRADMALAVVIIGEHTPDPLETIDWPPRRVAQWPTIAEIHVDST